MTVALYSPSNELMQTFTGPQRLRKMFPLQSNWTMELFDGDTSLGRLTEAQVIRWSNGGPIAIPEEFTQRHASRVNGE